MGSLSSNGPSYSAHTTGSLHFLKRLPLYKVEKPYSIRYNLPRDSDLPQTNSEHEEITGIPITDIRPHLNTYNLAMHGFAIIPLNDSQSPPTSSNGEANILHDDLQQPTYDDFTDDERIRSVYLPRVASRLRQALKAKHVQVYEHTIRRRDGKYPLSTGDRYDFDQPTNSAHIDVISSYVTEVATRINSALPKEVAQAMSEHQVQCINVWKPLRGPLHDWPLCVCDASTVDTSDLIPSDQVFPRHAVENIQVHFNKGQKWYFLSGQSADELWVFQQSPLASISEEKLPCGTPHCSFFNAQAPSNEFLRESIECRALVYFGDCAPACAEHNVTAEHM